jgi:hypothetical protein
MKFNKFILSVFISTCGMASAQTVSTSSNLVALPVPDRSITYSLFDAGVSKPITWGLDLAWLSEGNIRRGIAFMGADRVDVVRASFQPVDSIKNGDIQTAEITDLNTRLNLIDLTGTKTKVILNCDHPSVNSWFLGRADRWAQLIDITTKRVQARNRKVISVSPFNEPDFGWGQYSGSASNGQLDFLNIATELRKNTRFDSIRISGGNTLNCDQALPWYNALKSKLDEGNTHQLAGTFDNYASFFTTVRANGDYGTADELHNVMEAMVGVEYGMQTGIWWGTAELARGEFVKASDGKRLGYAEHRSNWTAASVYKSLEGKVQAFGGTSERQGVTTTYRFVSRDKDVYYDGYGPQREYNMTLPGGTGYQNGQTNAERVVNITWGEDIQPVINGKYILINRMSGKALEVLSSSTVSGATICQRTYKATTNQQWNVTPVDSRVGGDFSYFTFAAVHSAKVPDVLNFSLDNGAKVIQWDDNKNANQQWYLEYFEDGWFYIRNRNSNKCMEIATPYVTDGAVLQQADKTTSMNQQWRLIPVGSAVEFVAPAAPAGITATARINSIRLDWTANTETDLLGYNIYRCDSLNGKYNTIARNVNAVSFVDNSVSSGKEYFYKIKAVDNSVNRSGYSATVSATTGTDKDMVVRLAFDSNTKDSTINLNHSAAYTGTSFISGKTDKAISLNGSAGFVQLSPTVANSRDITIATWVYWNGATTWQRLFDFGNDQTQYMFLTPRASNNLLRFAIKNGGSEQILNSTAMLSIGIWTHVAVTMGSSGVAIYVNGIQKASSTAITVRPADFNPVLNYIGRSQFSSDPLFNGSFDEFRIYNYALSASEIGQLAGIVSEDRSGVNYQKMLTVSPIPANDILHIDFAGNTSSELSQIGIYGLNGKQVLSTQLDLSASADLNVSTLPAGAYLLRITNNEATVTRKLIISH